MIDYLFHDPIILITFFIVLLFKIFPPNKRNSWYGYRTKKSMKNESQWKYAQKTSANLGVLIFGVILFIQCLLYIFKIPTYEFVMLILFCIGTAVVIITTERKLRIREK